MLNLSISTINFTSNSEFYYRLLIDSISCLLLIRLIYYPIYKKREFFFTFTIFNIIIFFITYLMKNVEMSMGAAFGLFAVFSMLRYRTEGLSMKDMTYLFLVIALGLITAIGMGSILELCLLNVILLLFTYFLESNILIKKEYTKVIQYENIELIKPDKYLDLKLDLEIRTGLKITRVVIDSIDFLKDTALLTIHYHE